MVGIEITPQYSCLKIFPKHHFNGFITVFQVRCAIIYLTFAIYWSLGLLSFFWCYKQHSDEIFWFRITSSKLCSKRRLFGSKSPFLICVVKLWSQLLPAKEKTCYSMVLEVRLGVALGRTVTRRKHEGGSRGLVMLCLFFQLRYDLHTVKCPVSIVRLDEYLPVIYFEAISPIKIEDTLIVPEISLMPLPNQKLTAPPTSITID